MAHERLSGVLAHVSSLPGRYGLGDAGDALPFLRWIKRAGLRAWQFLPLTPVGAGDSPYSGPSAFAADPRLVSIERLVTDGLLARSEAEGAPRFPDGPADLAGAARWRHEALVRAHQRFLRLPARRREDAAGPSWLAEWCRFAAIAERLGDDWTRWPSELRDRRPEALARAGEALADRIGFHAFVQRRFADDWRRVREAARRERIELIGDVPFYVALGSADVWSRRETFRLDEGGLPTRVAGVPPDAFAAGGQLWGNPVYDWPRLAERGFGWWIDRLARSLELADRIRLDHFRGFAAFWSVPAGDVDAAGGRWDPGPGAALFDALRAALGGLPAIAEDLGDIDESVHRLREHAGIPGSRVLQFGLPDGDPLHRPSPSWRDVVAYTGTHDNPTTAGWYAALPPAEQARVRERLGVDDRDDEVVPAAIRSLLGSVAPLVVVPLQDLLGLDDGHRMNVPGTAEGNWRFRVGPDALSAAAAERVRSWVAFGDRFGTLSSDERTRP